MKHFLNPNKPLTAWVVWGLAAAFFFCDYFARVSHTVMVDDLMRAFKITAVGIGSLSAFFYYPYLGMQVPVGMLVDRFGVSRLLTIMCLLTGISCFVFGAAQSLAAAQFGRFLLGFGAAFAFVSALKLASEWFEPSRFGFLVCFTQALGMLGAAVGELPVSYSVQLIGWRNTMFVMVAIFAALSVLIVLFVRDKPYDDPKEKPRTTNAEIWPSLRWVLTQKQIWVNAFYVGLIYAPTTVFAELWGVAYLENTHHLSHHSAAFANGLIFIGWGVGGPLIGWLSDYLEKRKPIMLASAVCGLVFMGIVLFVMPLPAWQIYILLFLFGATNTGVAISYALAAESSPERFGGTAMAFTNMASVLFGACLQPIAGLILDMHSSGEIVNNLPVYTAADFHVALILMPLCSAVAFVMVFFIKETHGRNIVG